jgi:radical SAM protein with 4Fe4S-binding SPASM domain
VGGPPIPEISLADLLGEMHAEERRLPVEGTLETTYRCNLNCVHCYVNEPVGSRAAREGELSLDRLKALIDEIAEAGCLNVLMTGGEVLVRPDFAELYLYAIRKGLRVTVFTNGTLVTEVVADLLDRYRPLMVEVSLYGATAETYERITRVPGSYAKCLQGIERLRSRGIPLKLKTMAMTWNVDEIDAMRELAQRQGLEFKHDGLLNPRIDCGASRNRELQLGAEQVVALDLRDPDRTRRLREACEEALRPGTTVTAGEFVYGCGAGRNSFTVDPCGRLQMCQLSRRAHFDLREASFATGWNDYFPKLRERRWQSNSVCRSCSLISLCGSCPGAAELEHGDPEAAVAQFCEITHLRTHELMGEVSGHRRDATCCLGQGRLAAGGATAESVGGCGACSHARPADAEAPLIQIGPRSPALRAAITTTL